MLVHNYCGFFLRLFFSLKIAALFNFFHKNNLFSFQLMKMHIENHIHIRFTTSRKVGMQAAQSFQDLNELFGEGTISKS